MELQREILGAAFGLQSGQHKVQCPRCSQTRRKSHERTMSLRVENDGVAFQCWHCNENGFVKIEKGGMATEVVVDKPAKPIKTERINRPVAEWLESRGISEKTAIKAGVGYIRNYIGSLQKETDCITFPFVKDGKEYAHKIRSLETKGFSCNGSPQSFFNLQNFTAGEWLIIVEGEMDALSIMETGLDTAVSVPNGAPMKVTDGKIDPSNDNKFRFIWDAKDKIDLADRIVIATDGDTAGQAMAEEIARRIGKDRCWKVEWPEGCKDANDVLVKHGVDALREAVVQCKPWPVAGLYDASKFFEQVDEIYDKGMGRGESTGYFNVDDYYTIVEGQLTVVTGIPSSGKSEFIDQIMVNLAERKDWKFAICSFENEPRLHIAKLISKYCRMPFFDGATKRLSKSELERGKDFVQSHFSFLYQADGSLSTIESIVERMKIAVMRHGVRGVIIDPYNYIQRPTTISETEWISDMLTQLRVFAQAHGIHIWFVAHPTKMQRGMDGNVPVPKGYDISGSAAWFAKADVGMTVHRKDPISPVSDIHIWKCRFAWVGKQGSASLVYDNVTTRYNQIVSDPFLSPEDDDDDTEFPF